MFPFAEALIAADEQARAHLLATAPVALDRTLGRTLKAVFDTEESGDLPRALAAAEALQAVAAHSTDIGLHADAAWVAGMAAQIAGQLAESQRLLNQAAAAFHELDEPLLAAQTQVALLITLAMQGHYDEALRVGEAARAVFVGHNDLLAAGKIEQNLGNLMFRRDDYPAAERWYRQAQERFAALDDQKHLAQIENCLATALKWQGELRPAMQLYEHGLARATAAHLEITQAEIECNLGVLAMIEGHYTRGLRLLEESARRYAALALPHETALAELELADAYRDIRLLPEAAALYERITPIFADLGMRAEQARATAARAETALLHGDDALAAHCIAEATALYHAEQNPVGGAVVQLLDARLAHQHAHWHAAAASANAAAATFASVATWGRLLQAQWLEADARRALHDPEAVTLLQRTYTAARAHAADDVAYRCAASLGQWAAPTDPVQAAAFFEQAVALGETLRATLPANELRAAFMWDKHQPYTALLGLALHDAQPAAVDRAWQWAERAKARALLDALGLPAVAAPPSVEQAHLDTLRAEANWLYRQLDRAAADNLEPTALQSLQRSIAEREAALARVRRGLEVRTDYTNADGASLPVFADAAAVQALLPPNTVLLHYVRVDAEVWALVLTPTDLTVTRLLDDAALLDPLLAALDFQLTSMQHGSRQPSAASGQRLARVQTPLQRLYDLLLRPLAAVQHATRLVIVPHGNLHYIPFHALHDGTGYIVERHEVVYAPSATILQHCLARPRVALDNAVVVGVPDIRIPQVGTEIAAIRDAVPRATVLWDAAATVAAVRDLASSAPIVHIASHGQFRADNPLFSALQLFDGRLTVSDVAALRLQPGLVVLSGCETGRQRIAPGDELLGLVQGFFQAGAASLVVSQWPVDDATTATLMQRFYVALQAGLTPAAALRQAQQTLLREQPHPFFWAPFVVWGRW